MRHTEKTVKIMKTLIRKNQITATTADEVKSQVEQELQYLGYIVVGNRAEAEEYLREIDGDISEQLVQKFSVLGEIEGAWQITLTVTIKSYYKDSGSYDYCYQVNITED